ncbi:organic hydroperoxide resistance protein [Mucilaginibacter sp. L3T2-6]|uniref:organic hydroperoxide resistance protein n=1 Tax=Mucilaginibacter sp. L3T2-6 TaxID=3062491 RepID=UPI002674A9A2|nr:organic hydroperoxide resistance protein [Mucilaginibacter sp. L3T2-6]MDO3642871.1 organic hydroperoxide resistance protein [Mucilaginibacter sp. L3T2-6]MDV6215196.1 organic hydroperoxide resistance protein [Mucilaginibacter sp. L3T2-6]
MENQNVISSRNAANAGISKVLYTGKLHVTGGREGNASSSDGRLNITLSTPGGPGAGTNPEQLFAAGWSACFIGAMKHNASGLKIALPANLAVDTEVDLGTGDGGFYLQARLNVSLPGLTPDEARAVVSAAHETCPYSKATRGNINVDINVTV